MYGFFKIKCLGLQKFLPPTQSLLIFAARSCGDFSSWHWNLVSVGMVRGWDSLLPEISLLNFYPQHVCKGPACFVFMLLLPVWRVVVSLIP